MLTSGESIPVCLTLVPETQRLLVALGCPRWVGVTFRWVAALLQRVQDRELSQAWGQRWAARGSSDWEEGQGTSSPIPSPLPNPSKGRGC